MEKIRSIESLKDIKQWEYRGGTQSKNNSVLHYQNIIDKDVGAYAISLQKMKVDPRKILTNSEMIELLKKALAAKRASVSFRPDIKSTITTWAVPKAHEDTEDLQDLLAKLKKIEAVRANKVLKTVMKRSDRNLLEI